MKTPWRWGHWSTSPWVRISSLLTRISSLIYRIGRLTYSFSSKSDTRRSRTRLLTTVLFFLSRVDKDIFVPWPFTPSCFIRESVQKLELLPLSRKAYVTMDLSLPFTLTFTGITAMPVLQRSNERLATFSSVFAMLQRTWAPITSSVPKPTSVVDAWRGRVCKMDGCFLVQLAILQVFRSGQCRKMCWSDKHPKHSLFEDRTGFSQSKVSSVTNGNLQGPGFC